MTKLEKPLVSVVSQLNHTESSPIALPAHYTEFAGVLITIHGSVRVAQEERGLHFYIACPECLEENGASEIYKKHLALNVDRYFQGENHRAMCMKCGTTFNIPELTAMRPLAERGIEYKAEVAPMSAGPNMDLLEKDETGALVPKNPGRTIPVVELGRNHPAIVYLASRHFDPEALWRQFRCSYCQEENPDLYYRKQPGGFRVTPQGRLIFFGYQGGARMTWQARILEMEDGNDKYFYHPYKRQWVHVLSRPDARAKWAPREGYEDWDPAKYFTAPGTRRNSIVMGYDAALGFNAEKSLHNRWCMIMEGPLDAGRLGAPAMAILGKHLSENQASLLEDAFHRIVALKDNDAAGEKSAESIKKQFATRNVLLSFLTLPDKIKDPGELSPNNAKFIHNVARKMAFSK
jgi:hypothetical protein